ncbi:MAG: S-layer homology domain-containing protein [Acidimicrobiaceae bacterium]|nr:S-layer homology domain-containing protein [Acidimicrobiaceae bacterium]
MQKRSAVAAVLLASVLAAGVAAPAAAQGQRFPDVPPDHYALEAVEWAAAAGVTAGYNDGTFKPQQPLSKRHAVVFMERYYDEILRADQSDDFTRGDMMVLLKAINDGTFRGAGTPKAPSAGAGGGERFPDVPTDHYAFEAVEWAAAAGVTAGYNDGTFKPQQPLSKRHAVVFMDRYYDEILKADQSDDFTRGDMMVLLKAINDGTLRDTSTPTRIAYTVVDPDTGARALYVANADGANTTKIADSTIQTAVWSPDGTRIAYTVGEEYPAALYVANADGTDTTKLTDIGSGWWKWSPDGTRVAYDAPAEHTRFDTLYVANADGTDTTKINYSTSWAEWSPDGTRIAYTNAYAVDDEERIVDDTLYVANADGTNTTRIADPPISAAVWSPDGTRISYRVILNHYTGESALYVANADGTNTTKIADPPMWAPVWSPDGTRVSYRAADPETSVYALYVATADGTGSTRITDSSYSSYSSHSSQRAVWSPDGTRIAYTVLNPDTGESAPYVANADGTNTTKLTDSGSGPRWSPDGTRIAYRVLNPDTGESALYVANPDGTNPTKLADSAGFMQWSPS